MLIVLHMPYQMKHFSKFMQRTKKTQNNMFFQKQNEWHWRLRVELLNKPAAKITAVAFEIPATEIMNNLSAKAAIKMQTKEIDKVAKMAEKVHNADAYLSSLQCEEST